MFQDALDTLRTEDAAVLRRTVEEVRADGRPRDIEVRRVQDGRIIAGRVTRLADSTVMGVSMDVTELRAAEAALLESERQRAAEVLAASERLGEHNALLLASSGAGIFSIGADGVCTSANPAAARLLGYEVSDMVGRETHGLVHHSHPDGSPYPSRDCPIQRSLVTGVGARVAEEVFWRRDNTRLPIEYSTFPLADDGVVRGAVITFTDATDRRHATAELESAGARLRQGIRDGELRLYYQPKVHLLTGRCDSVEALVRWQRDDALGFPMTSSPSRNGLASSTSSPAGSSARPPGKPPSGVPTASTCASE